MNRAETVDLCDFVRRLKPSKRWDEGTPEAWHYLLTRYRLDDAKAAAVEVAARSEWIEVAEIVAEIRRIRRRRLEAVGEADLVPNVDPDDVAAYRAEARAIRESVANGYAGPAELAAYRRGELPTLTGAPQHITAGSLKARDMRAITATVKDTPK